MTFVLSTLAGQTQWSSGPSNRDIEGCRDQGRSRLPGSCVGTAFRLSGLLRTGSRKRPWSALSLHKLSKGVGVRGDPEYP